MTNTFSFFKKCLYLWIIGMLELTLMKAQCSVVVNSDRMSWSGGCVKGQAAMFDSTKQLLVPRGNQDVLSRNTQFVFLIWLVKALSSMDEIWGKQMTKYTFLNCCTCTGLWCSVCVCLWLCLCVCVFPHLLSRTALNHIQLSSCGGRSRCSELCSRLLFSPSSNLTPSLTTITHLKAQCFHAISYLLLSFTLKCCQLLRHHISRQSGFLMMVVNLWSNRLFISCHSKGKLSRLLYKSSC